MRNTGSSRLFGDLGVFPGSSIIGFPPGQVIGGVTHLSDAVASQAQTDVTAAYTNLAAQPSVDKSGIDLGGLTLVAGAYRYTSSAQLTGTLTLDAQGNAAAVWVFQMGSALTTASGSRVVVINGGSPCNVFWQVGSSAVLGTTTAFAGNILALTDITLTTGATVSGRVLARNGIVTLDTNDISSCSAVCGAISLAPTTVPAGTVSTAYSQAFTASGGAGPYTFSVTSGTLPTGLTLSSFGTLSGTPSVAGTYAFTITASDSTACTGSQAYSLLVNPSGGALGDPHMHMLDGLAYDFQACGEFVLLRSGVSGLEVQTRLQPWAGGTSVNTEIALKAGTHVVSINLNDPACDPSTQRDIAGCVKVDHLSVDFRCQASDSDPRCLKVFPLPGVGSLEEHIVGVSEGKKSRKLDPSCDVRQGGAACLPMPSDAPCVTAITLRLFTGEVIESCLGPGYINLRADLPLAVRGLTSGLLGNADGDPTNDLVPQGSSVPLAVSTTYEQFYRGYGDSWRVSAESSMLTPLTGQPQACSSSVFQLSDLSPAQVTHGTQLCQDLGINAGNLDARITDVALIGDSAAYGYVGLVAPQAKVTLTGSFVPGLGDSPGAGALNTLGANAFGDDPTRGANAVGCGGCGASGSGPSAFIFAALALALVAMSRRRAV